MYAEALEPDVNVAPALGKTLADFGVERKFGAALSQTLANFGAERHLQRAHPLAKPADCLRRFDVHLPGVILPSSPSHRMRWRIGE